MTKSIEDTINLLVQDNVMPAPRLKITLALCVLVPLSIALVCLASVWTSMPLRADYALKISEPYVLAKQAIPVLLLLSLVPILTALFRPEGRIGRLIFLPIGVIGILFVLVFTELFAQPIISWSTLIVGKSIPQCLIGVNIIALAGLGISLYILRQGAVTHPVLCGFLAGILAGSLAAFLYAFICTEDSPLFYGVWYSLAVLGTGGIGAIMGNKILRW